MREKREDAQAIHSRKLLKEITGVSSVTWLLDITLIKTHLSSSSKELTSCDKRVSISMLVTLSLLKFVETSVKWNKEDDTENDTGEYGRVMLKHVVKRE